MHTATVTNYEPAREFEAMSVQKKIILFRVNVNIKFAWDTTYSIGESVFSLHILFAYHGRNVCLITEKDFFLSIVGSITVR